MKQAVGEAPEWAGLGLGPESMEGVWLGTLERLSLILKGADLGQGKKWSSGMGQTWSEVVVRVLDSSGLRVGRAWWFLKEQPRPRKGAVKKICFKVGGLGSGEGEVRGLVRS